MTRESRRRMTWVTLFGIGFGWVEAALVVYLRLLYYPEGFHFPLKMIPMDVAWIELVREAATILMLAALGILAGRTKLERFGYFMMAFGVWDIVYYIGLYAMIGWPQSLLTWDLLFLLPVPWIGPVLAPVLVSVGLITACALIVRQEDVGRPMNPPVRFWLLEVLFGLIIILSFTLDYPTAFSEGTPDRFRWEVFLLGLLPGFGLLLRAWWLADRQK